MRNIVLRFDMRSAPQCPQTPAERYRAALDMACWADRNTVDVIGLSEHHDTNDGFLSSPLQLAGMMAACTERIRISVSALLVPLHDPLRLAEDIALLDRAARFKLFFCPAIDDPDLERTYLAACHSHGFKYGFTISPRAPSTTFLSEDPAACWKDIGDYLMYDATAYGAWRHPNRRAYAESFASNIEELMVEGKYRVLTPEQALQTILETGSLHLAPLAGGVPLDIGWRSLQLFEDYVQPYL